jgi:hypothetical protein
MLEKAWLGVFGVGLAMMALVWGEYFNEIWESVYNVNTSDMGSSGWALLSLSLYTTATYI